MTQSLTTLMIRSGATWVLELLLALSVVSLALALERWLAFRHTDGQIEQLVRQVRQALRQRGERAAAHLLEASKSVPGRVALAGMAESERGAPAVEEAMAAARGLERQRLEKYLLILGTIGSNAPFIGLLGTVIGVIGAFDALGTPGAAVTRAALAPEGVMSAIAEALVSTAVGLVVAIPAVAVFNYFQGRVGAALADAETLGHVLLAYVRGEHDVDTRVRRRPREHDDSSPRLRDGAAE